MVIGFPQIGPMGQVVSRKTATATAMTILLKPLKRRFWVHQFDHILTVCHGKKKEVNHLFRLGPSKNHGYVTKNQRVLLI